MSIYEKKRVGVVMGGRIEILKDVVYDTGLKHYRDISINKGTRSVFDVSNTWAGGAGDIGQGAIIKDLTFNNYEGSFNKAKKFKNGGMIFTGVGNDGFDFEQRSIMSSQDKHWMMTVWLKITSAGAVNSFNNQTLHFATTGLNDGNQSLLSLVPTTNASGNVTTVELRVRGKNYVVTSQVMPLYDGNVHQLSVECSVSQDGATQRVIIFIDKVKVYDSGNSAVATALPGEPTVRRVGTSASLPLAWGGSFYRARVDDLAVSGLLAEEVITADYESAHARFS
ncbi:hypothetical protein ACMAV9_13140 [Klebsiella pneumoniae]|uniref:hypothetical protein n=1 Tax=Klebsiella pneumoniae TaxID=573 RepID=UPI00143547B7|nr:hypothetical protein [Klebsiella pneumoniae]QIV08452.1 hypothetical protein HC709_03405 [Klebsiella pneumoniae]